jgi:pyridoxine 4-dehydrogenase
MIHVQSGGTFVFVQVKVGPLTVSPMGIGTWAWGNQLLWGYEEEMDEELQRVFNFAISKGINFFDTADSYGTGKLNGRSELLLGKFIQEYRGGTATSPLHPIA